jgi:hypothetical protein
MTVKYALATARAIRYFHRADRAFSVNRASSSFFETYRRSSSGSRLTSGSLTSSLAKDCSSFSAAAASSGSISSSVGIPRTIKTWMIVNTIQVINDTKNGIASSMAISTP